MWRMLQKTKKRKSILSKDRNRINLRLGVFQCSHQREQKTQRGPAMSEQLTLNPVSYIVLFFFMQRTPVRFFCNIHGYYTGNVGSKQ